MIVCIWWRVTQETLKPVIWLASDSIMISHIIKILLPHRNSFLDSFSTLYFFLDSIFSAKSFRMSTRLAHTNCWCFFFWYKYTMQEIVNIGNEQVCCIHYTFRRTLSLLCLIHDVRVYLLTISSKVVNSESLATASQFSLLLRRVNFAQRKLS